MIDSGLSLKSRVIQASSWTMLGYGGSQFIRFLGHLLLARLLLPEDFGLAQLVNTFLIALTMFSDLGIRSSVIQHKSGEETEFLRTAWTIQVLRGGLIWLMTFLIAWPMALLYEAPKILWLLPFAGMMVLINGFNSTYILLLNRHMKLGKLTTLNTVAEILGVMVTLSCAWIWREVWTLLSGGLFTAFLQLILSHVAYGGPRMRFQWAKEAANEIIHFGKWIFVSSFTTFLTSRLDILFMGFYLTKRELGFYSIAASLVGISINAVAKLSDRVLVPLYSHLRNHAQEQMTTKILKTRAILAMVSLPPLYILAIWGQSIINWLYPPVYHDVGWMLRILAIGGSFTVITVTIRPIFIAMGDSFRLMLVQFTQSLMLLIPMVIGGHFFGVVGLIVATAPAQLLNYPILASSVKRYGVWLPAVDFTAFSLSLVVVVIQLFVLN